MEIIPNYHPLLVHFSIALLSMATVFYSAAFVGRNHPRSQSLLTAACWNLWAGTCISLITVLTGWLAYNSVAHDALSHEAMTVHKNWALPTLALWLVAILWDVFVTKGKAGMIFVLWLWLSTAALMVTGYLGAENVYRHGIGVMRLPDVETGQSAETTINKAETKADHDHEHAPGHEH